MHTAKNGLVVEVFCKEARLYSDKASSNQVIFTKSRLFLCRVLIIGKALGEGGEGGRGMKCFLDRGMYNLPMFYWQKPNSQIRV